MSEYIEVGQPLQFTDPNTPTRVGEIVENVSDIYNIPSPRLGMQVFVKSEKKSFVITSLKSKVIGGVNVPEAAVEAFEPVGAKSITWNNDTDPSNMNDFVVAGVYDIKGERTRANDNLPILNTGGGHSFNARLTVLDSSIPGDGKNDDKCITQVLSFSNRLGQGEVYIRTGKGSSLDNLTWEKWSTLQRNVNVGEVTSLDHLIDNGIYSGVYVKNDGNIETFVMVVINNYALAGINNLPKSISQFKYSVSLGGSFAKYETRVGTGVNDWGDWEILNKDEITSMISAEIKKVTDGIDPKEIDSIKDIVAWINAHGGEVTAIYNAITAERTRAIGQEGEIKQNTIAVDSMSYSTTTDDMSLEFETLDGESHGSVTFPAATTESAGVMSAVDKEKLDSLSQGGDITAVPTDVVIEEIEPNLVSTAIRKTPQVLTDSEKEIARGNIGAADAMETSIAITTNVTNINNEIIRAKQAEADAIEKGRQLALRALFIAAGAEYNDTGADKTKTAPWGETVTHKAGHYYLNGLGDITEEQMSEIYTSDKFWISKDARGFLSGYKVRTNITAKAAELFRSFAYNFAYSVYECPNLEVLVLCNPASTSDTYRTITISEFSDSLYSVRKLKRIFGILNLRSTTTTNLHATVLEHINILGLMCNLNISKTGVISKESVLYMIQKAAPTSTITITLHADAYARLANNADIVAALEAQPLITLVSA